MSDKKSDRRKDSVIRRAWCRIMASYLAERPRSKELIREASQILGKEMKRAREEKSND